MSRPSRITLSLTYRLAVIAVVLAPHNVAELRGAAILLLLGHAAGSAVRYIHNRIGDWIVRSIDWTGPLTQPWRQLTMVETFARLGTKLGEIAAAYTALGTAFARTYRNAVVNRALAEEAAEHANREGL